MTTPLFARWRYSNNVGTSGGGGGGEGAGAQMVVSSTTSAAMAPEVGATLGKCGSGRRNVVTGRENGWGEESMRYFVAWMFEAL